MNARRFRVLSIGIAMAIIVAGIPSVSAQGEAPLTLNLNIGSDPTTLDPALAVPWDMPSVAVIEQLFIGLVDLDDDTAEIRPELATSWTISPDGTVYTFHLRGDVFWSDGTAVTAGDVRYGILRVLDPATAAENAWSLFLIKNAAAYNDGSLSDPDHVGVTVIDPATLRITLEGPASYALHLFSLSIARPMPRWAIEAWGDAWTDPSHIVTNGPYRLTEWVHHDTILLDKNPTYFDVANVGIDRVRIWMVDQDTAWTMYRNGQLDTADVPPGTSFDPVSGQAVRFQPIISTYFLGLNPSQPPFTHPLVRRAFIAATDRAGLIRHTAGVQQPALTLSPPGVFGHIDGYAEGVGVPYSPNQARAWLAEAGYPGGQGLPPITLWYNDSPGNQTVIGYIRDSWYATLGVTVTLGALDWTDYLNQLPAGEFQAWRLGWLGDYPEAANYLLNAINYCKAPLGAWYNSTYEDLLQLALRTGDQAARRTLYRQMEKILVETDLVVLPIYYDRSRVAAQPYLQRTFAANSVFDIATWRITRVSDTASPDAGGTLTSYRGDTTIAIPAGAITDTLQITHSPSYGMPPAGNLTTIGTVFELTAVDKDSGLPAGLAPGQTYRLTVHYTDAERGPAIEDTLALYYWDGSQWIKEASSRVDTKAKTVTAEPSHFSQWAVLGETWRLYAPLVLRNY